MKPACELFYKIILFYIFTATGFNCFSQEICNNRKDDDGNGLADLFDPACQCNDAANLLLNGSFESFDHCPETYTYDKDYKIADYWQFGTYNNIGEAYYYHNLGCGYDSGLVMQNMPPALPLPGGKAFISVQNISSFNTANENEITKSYVGQCLQTPLQKGKDYTLNFYAGRFRSWDNYTGRIFPFTVAVFGNTDCNAVPFGKKYVFGNGCPANYTGWVLLGKATINSSGKWVQGKIDFTVPDEIKVIEIGPDCSVLPQVADLTDSTTFLDFHVYYLDKLQLLPKDFSSIQIKVQTGNNCGSLPLLKAPFFANATYQWYKDSLAIAGATDSSYQVLDNNGVSYYNVSIKTGDSCFISAPFPVSASNLVKIKIPTDTILCANDSILLAPEAEGITYSLNGITGNNAIVNQPGIYTLIATDIYGCSKTFNVQVTQQNCSDCNAFIPNAFTPNHDGLNDLFKLSIYCSIQQFHLSIFNRWGKKIFESSDINTGWNGTYSDKELSAGVYVYYVDYKTSSGIIWNAKGTIALIR